MRKIYALSGLFFVLAANIVACSSSSSEDDADQGGAAVSDSSCSQERKDDADRLLANAVGMTLEREGEYCDKDEIVYLSTIAGKVHEAATACGSVRDDVRSGTDGAAIRETLAGSISLAVLDGRLDPKTMKGLPAVLESGVTLYGPAPGVWGNESTLKFGPNNQAVISRMDHSVEPATWTDTTVSYRLGETNEIGAKITITEDGKATVYWLFYGRELFDLTLGVDGNPMDGINYTTFPSECGG